MSASSLSLVFYLTRRLSPNYLLLSLLFVLSIFVLHTLHICLSLSLLLSLSLGLFSHFHSHTHTLSSSFALSTSLLPFQPYTFSLSVSLYYSLALLTFLSHSKFISLFFSVLSLTISQLFIFIIKYVTLFLRFPFPLVASLLKQSPATNWPFSGFPRRYANVNLSKRMQYLTAAHCSFREVSPQSLWWVFK